MKRLDFLRTAILAAIATPVLLPEILKEHSKITWQDVPIGKSIGYPYDKDALSFRITRESLKDQEIFNHELYYIAQNREIKSIEIGIMEDDFIANTYTVKLMFL